LQRGRLLQDGFAQLELQCFGIHLFVGMVDLQHTPERVIFVRRLVLELRLHLSTGDQQAQHSLERQQHTEDTQCNNDVADDATLVDPLPEIRGFHEQSEDLSGGGIKAETHDAVAGCGGQQARRAAREPALLGLTLKFGDGVGFGIVREVAAVRHQVESSDADHIFGADLAVRGNDLEVSEALDLTEFSGFAL